MHKTTSLFSTNWVHLQQHSSSNLPRNQFCIKYHIKIGSSALILQQLHGSTSHSDPAEHVKGDVIIQFIIRKWKKQRIEGEEIGYKSYQEHKKFHVVLPN